MHIDYDGELGQIYVSLSQQDRDNLSFQKELVQQKISVYVKDLLNAYGDPVIVHRDEADASVITSIGITDELLKILGQQSTYIARVGTLLSVEFIDDIGINNT